MRRLLRRLPRCTTTLARRAAAASRSSSSIGGGSGSSGDDDVKVDRSGLGTAGYAPPKPPATPLGRELESQIRARGPVSVHEYVKQCLLHPTHGYYARKGAVHNFGAGGDFVTAPELSPMAKAPAQDCALMA